MIWTMLIFFPQNVIVSRQEALLYVFEDNEAVIKMIIKGRSSTMRHVSKTHRVALDWLFDRISWTPRSRPNTLTPKNQLVDILTKLNFTRDEWNHLLCLFNISNFISTDCSEVISKRTQKDSGGEGVAAKSKPMMNLVSRCSDRNPEVLASSASESRVKTRYERLKVLLSSLTVQQTGTVRPVSNKLVVDIDMDSDTAAESDLSLKSRSFLNRVNDRLQKMLNRSPEDSMQDIDKRSMIWECLSSTVEASVFMGKNYSDNLHSIKNGSICIHGKELLRQFTFHQKYR